MVRHRDASPALAIVVSRCTRRLPCGIEFWHSRGERSSPVKILRGITPLRDPRIVKGGPGGAHLRLSFLTIPPTPLVRCRSQHGGDGRGSDAREQDSRVVQAAVKEVVERRACAQASLGNTADVIELLQLNLTAASRAAHRA